MSEHDEIKQGCDCSNCTNARDEKIEALEAEVARLLGFEPCVFVSQHNVRRGACGTQRRDHGDTYHAFTSGAFRAEIAPAREPMMSNEELHGGSDGNR